MEIIDLEYDSKHITHYKTSGAEKIQFDKKNKDKYPLVLDYVANYCKETGYSVLETKSYPTNRYGQTLITHIILVKK